MLEVFADICNGNLTNMETDAFIKKSTENFKLSLLKIMIIDYERYVQKERTDLLIYFDYMYGDRKKFTKDGKIADEETLNKIIDEYKSKYKDSPEIVHSDYDSGSQEITDFSPLVSEFITEKTKDNYHQSISLQTTFGFVARSIFGWKGDLLTSVAPAMISAFALSSMNSPRFKKTVGRLTGELVTDDFDSENEFTVGLRCFLASPAYHFHVKLHTLYNLLKKKLPYQDHIVSEPSTEYKPNSPEREVSPKKCAQDFINESGYTKFSAHVIEFVMAHADRCDYDNIDNLIREIREHPECPDEIKDKNKDSKAERNWINYYYKKNKIPKGKWKKGFSSTSEN